METQKLPYATGIIVLGILSIISSCCYGIFGLLFSIIALVLAGMATSKYKESPELYDNYGTITTGKVLAIIGLVISVLVIAFFVWIFSAIGWDVLMSNDQEAIQEAIQDLFGQP